ncbi:hypothetical protein Q7A53_14320 [Halobacillus rhizosphaerae]|uniref:hypothetical protein n=1 Tax=Halobacillus rhizosphaerae TaxID=3064889 RepID=UPI00398B29CB
MNQSDLLQKLIQLQKDNSSSFAQIKEQLSVIKQKKNIHYISYFTYSLNISHSAGQESLCMGSYHILNLGKLPLTNPYICIKTTPDSPFHFSGKYVYKNSKHKMNIAGAWERLNDPKDKEEFWLQPLTRKVIQPNETLSFSNFQLKWTPEKSYAGGLLGFSYCDECKEGITAINQVNLNGNTPDGEGGTNEQL